MKIEHLIIFSRNLEKQKRFYKSILDFPVREISGEAFLVEIGYSTLEFRQNDSATPYHIAFHIPSIQEELALLWLKDRVQILKNENEEIVDFPAWSAKSIYFYDEDRNIIELISRKSFHPASSTVFSSQSIFGISEIGLAVQNVEAAYNALREGFSLEKYTGDFETFCATGDDEGLFIIIDKDKMDWFPVDDKAYASEFEVKISTDNRQGRIAYKNERLRVL